MEKTPELDLKLPVANTEVWTPAEINPLESGRITQLIWRPRGEEQSTQPTKAEATQAKILAAAKVVLVEDGAEGFSVRRVAKAASVGFGNVQYYYPSKAHLLQAMVLDLAKSFWRFYEKRLAPVSNPRDRFIACAEFVLNGGPEPNMVTSLREFWSLAQRDDAIGQTMSEFNLACRRLAASLIKEINPELSNDQARLLGGEAVSMIIGAFVYIEPFGEQDSLSGFKNHLLQRIMSLSDFTSEPNEVV